MRIYITTVLCISCSFLFSQPGTETFNNHKVLLDNKGKIISWITPQREAYHQFLGQRWNFIKTGVPNSPGPAPRSNYPQYFFYCAYKLSNGLLEPDNWMNDVGEKVPNWVESARLYYAYSGDSSVMEIVQRLADYAIDHGTSPADFSWPNFPYTTTNAGDTIFRGFTSAKRFALHEIQVDHAGDMGLAYYRLYQYTGKLKYRTAAINVANTLVSKVRTGTATQSPWPYRVIMNTGMVTAEYGANWFGCYELLDELQKAGLGKTNQYTAAMVKVRDFMINYPLKTGYWTDGHTDTDINSYTYKSNMSASNAKLFMFDHPEFNTSWKADIPRLIRWTEENFIERSASGEPSSQWGANIVGEQDSFLYKMDYQTARYAAECARWYAISGDEGYKEKAYRSLNWVTYCNDENGLAYESPLSKNINSWWSDCYGEGPRMFYHAFAAVPEWAPPGQDHILYSTGMLKNVSYKKGSVKYTTCTRTGKEYLKLINRPVSITLNGKKILYESRKLEDGGYAVTISRTVAGEISVTENDISSIEIKIDPSKKYQRIDGIGVNANTRSWGDELKPALHLLLDSMKANIWRVVVETVEKWEDENDNSDPFTFNWDYYNKLYETPKFQKAWNMIAYLNSMGITDQLMINFMGPVPAWMGKKTVLPQYQDEYVEMICSFFWYAKNVKHLKIGIVSPTNESDWRNEGPELNEFEYAQLFRKFIDRMNALGMSDMKYVGPDPADMKAGMNRYIPEMMKDSVIMSKLAHFGLHSYGGYYANVDSALKDSKYPNSTFWITEWNAWRDGLDDGKIGVYDFKFASQCVGYLLDLLKHGASGAMEWEGYDSYYEHHYPSLFSYWGILGYDSIKKIYNPRKHFYAIQQVTKFLKPGSRRIEVTGGDSLNTVGFYDSTLKTATLTGLNHYDHPVEINVESEFKIFYTDDSNNLKPIKVKKIDSSFSALIPPNSIFTLTTEIKKTKPQPKDWYTGDIHVHRNCGSDSILPEKMLPDMMEENDLDVMSVLADMGNGEVKDAPADLEKINGMDAPQSSSKRIIHWDAEWHWDATYSSFSHQALGGHLVLLGLKHAEQIWDESPYKIIDWAKKQNAVKGFCHMQYLDNNIQDELNCCIPIDYPVEAALGNIDFVAEDVYGTGSPNNGNYSSEAAMNSYYRLLNCGFKIGLAAGTDYPCNNFEAPGKLLTYVNVKGGLTYQKWIEGIRKGKTVVSRNGNSEFLQLTIGGTHTPGDVINISGGGEINIEVKWTAAMPLDGTIEIVCNGKVIASLNGNCSPGKPVTMKASPIITKSSWIIARRMNGGEHQSHTAPVYIYVDNKPIRASEEDAKYFVRWIDNILEKTATGGTWNRYYTADSSTVMMRYKKARDLYLRIAGESKAEEEKNASVLIVAQPGNYSAYTAEMLRAEGFRSFAVTSIGELNHDYLKKFDCIILPKTELPGSVTLLMKQYVHEGGNLISFCPDWKLASLFGLKPMKDSIQEGYISISDIPGLLIEPLQFHGTAGGYELVKGKVIASLQKNNTTYPAIVFNEYGNGRLVAFTYNLPQSIAWTRQGNPADAGVEKDGIKGLRSMDLFTGGWVDVSKNTLNQADEQMRLLTYCIGELNQFKKPIPRFWYFPDTLRSLVTLTNDGEYSDEKDIKPQFDDVEEKGANMSLYILTAEKISKALTDAWRKSGNEISGHPDDTKNAEHPDWKNMNEAISVKLQELKTKYAIPSMQTIVNHWFVWCGTDEMGRPDYSAQARIERDHGIEMDINYAHYDNNSVSERFLGHTGILQGNFTGSGLPMKFADASGNVINIYQHLNNVYDQQYMENKDSIGFFDCFKGLMDRSIDNEIYSYICVKCHNDEYYFSKVPLSRMLGYAAERGIPVWTAEKLLDFLKARDAASFQNITWTGEVLSFRLSSPLYHEKNLTCMIPYVHKGKKIRSITSGAVAQQFTVRSIKGKDYAMLPVKTGTAYRIIVQYSNK